MAFETGDPARNLASAAAAWRALGDDEDMVIQHDTGVAVFGNAAQLEGYALQHDLKDGWTPYDDNESLFSLKYDMRTMREVTNLFADQDLSSARKDFKDFHWGDVAQATKVVEIPGVQGPLVFLGVARRFDYYAVKDGEPAEYYHYHGEESGKYPYAYALPGNTGYVVFGGNMKITPDGIRD